jgi:hypothetical protein
MKKNAEVFELEPNGEKATMVKQEIQEMKAVFSKK